MADVKISALPAAASVATTDTIPIVQTGVTDRATIAQVRTALMPVVLTADVSGVLPSANAPSHTGDVTGAHSATVVAKVNGATVPAAGALTTGNVLQVSGLSALSYGPVNLAGGANYVTGSLPAASQAAQTMAGDVTGTTAVSVVAKINGATVSASGALTTGNLLQVSGASALTYGPLNVGGGANYVTGTLPSANQIAQTMLGDVTGTTGASVVVKVNGATVPASGALTTGNAAYVSGVSALTYSALNLAGGTGWVTGALPALNGGLGTSAAAFTGVLKFAAGVASASTIVNADVNAAAAIAGTKIAPNFGAQDVVTTGSYSAGTTPATTGPIRLPNNSDGVNFMHSSGVATVGAFGLSSSNELYLGCGNGSANKATTVYVYPTNGGQLLTNATGVVMAWSDTAASFGLPIIGYSSPYGVHGTVISAMGDVAYTVPASEYAYSQIVFTQVMTAVRAVKLPTPATEAASYTKELVNTTNMYGLTISRADGAGVTVTLAVGTKGTFRVRPAGVYICATAIAAP